MSKLLLKLKSLSSFAVAMIFVLSFTLSACGNEGSEGDSGAAEETTEMEAEAEESHEHPSDGEEHPAGEHPSSDSEEEASDSTAVEAEEPSEAPAAE